MAPPAAIAVDLSGSADTSAPVFIEKLSINGVTARRAKAPQLSKVVAAHASSDMFKGPVRLRSRNALLSRQGSDADARTAGGYVEASGAEV